LVEFVGKAERAAGEVEHITELFTMTDEMNRREQQRDPAFKEEKEEERRQKCTRRLNSRGITRQPALCTQIGHARCLVFEGQQLTK